ncbi:AMP-binding protein [uncultured Thiodictyon sp.]|uniref:AMP-binding protein n=1 Tax=uncultured Thiodictyon sp. TaxID=1846217 RepID=UPI0025E75DD4|nr:AMP-binding protein [uncultured Thiodictyon sp.]
MLLDHLDSDHEVLIEASSGNVVTVGAIRDRGEPIGEMPRGLAFLLADGTMDAAFWFLALLEARFPVALIDAGSEWPTVARLIDRYRPDMIIDPAGRHLGEHLASPLGPSGRIIEQSVWLASEFGPELHGDLAVLLTTSGSTGSPKFVRLSSANIRANAEQIVHSLGIIETDRAVTVLPLFYSFGMSVITSHALAGSSVLVTSSSVIEEAFWSSLHRHGVTFLPGVPTTYTMLKRLGFESRELPKLRALIQAGGRLAPTLIGFFHDVMARRGGQFIVMYGQTEASPRMSCMPSTNLPTKLGSVGLAMRGSEFVVCSPGGEELATGQVGEVVYCGPNVMMGYAEGRDDLTLGATHGRVLVTGDLGYLDDEGFLYLTGRSKRICKLAGSRVSLDEIEQIAGGLSVVPREIIAVSCDDEKVVLFATGIDPAEASDLRKGLAAQLRVPPMLIEVRTIAAIPLLPSGKPDYTGLARSAGARADRI